MAHRSPRRRGLLSDTLKLVYCTSCTPQRPCARSLLQAKSAPRGALVTLAESFSHSNQLMIMRAIHPFI